MRLDVRHARKALLPQGYRGKEVCPCASRAKKFHTYLTRELYGRRPYPCGTWFFWFQLLLVSSPVFSGFLASFWAPYFLRGFFLLSCHPASGCLLLVKPGHPSVLGPGPSGLDFCHPAIFHPFWWGFFCPSLIILLYFQTYYASGTTKNRGHPCSWHGGCNVNKCYCANAVQKTGL